MGLAVAGGAPAESVLKVIPHADLKNLDPIWTTAYITRNHGYLVFDVLFALDEEQRIQPQMVKDYQVSEDGLVHTLSLRAGLRFHDGAPVTADDVVASLKRWGKRDGMGQKLMAAVDRIEATGPASFQIVLAKPFGLVLAALGKISSTVPFIMPKRLAETDPFEQIPEAVGSGPFIFDTAAWVPGDRVVYRRNPDYKPRAEPASGAAGGKVVHYDELHWLYIPDPQTAVNALIAGELDYVENPALDLVEQLKKTDGITVKVIDPLGSQGWMRLNHLLPPFDNVVVRRAVQWMVDQEDYLRTAVGSAEFYKVCPATFVCDTPLASDINSQAIMTQDFDKAKALLAEAGYAGEKVVLLHPTDVVNMNAFSAVTAHILRQAGMNVEVQAMDWSTLTSRRAMKEPVDKGGWHIFHTSWSSPDVINPVVNAGVSGGCTESAWFGWPCDDALEAMRDRFSQEADPAKQKALAEAIQARANDLVTYIPLGQYYSPIAYRSSLRGVLNAPVPLFWNIELE